MITNTTLVGAGITVIGVLLVSEGASSKTSPNLSSKEIGAGLILAAGGLVTTAVSLMGGTRRERHP